jgi:hypothetical protein
MEPAFKEAAATLAKQTTQARLAQIDCADSDNQPICEKHEIKGYPTLKLYKAGKFVEEYRSQRDAATMVNYMNRFLDSAKAPPPVCP